MLAFAPVPGSAGLAETDATLVSLVAARDPIATETLYGIVRQLVRGIAFRKWHGNDPADLIHEVLTTVVEAIQTGVLRNPGALRAYIRAIADRQCANRVGEEIRTRRRMVNSEDAMRHVQCSHNPEKEMLLRERTELLALLMQRLRSHELELMTRFYLREQAHEQICEEMHITENQFRLCKNRAKAKLSAWFARPAMVDSLMNQEVGRSGAGTKARKSAVIRN